MKGIACFLIFLIVFTLDTEALLTFESFSYSNKKYHVDWVSEAIPGETRGKLVAEDIQWPAEGKVRNWKFIR